MKKNMGTLDKGIRTLVAALLGYFIYTGAIVGTLSIVLGIVAAVFLLTCFVSFCPLYVPLGMTTCKKNK
jgi:hypothetical protein